jgi:formate-dependent nitrite reductase membrane component NrfD
MKMSLPDSLDLKRQDLGQVYRPQREWIEGRGVLIVVAHFLSGVGAGAWLWSVLFDFPLGQAIAFVTVVVFSGIAHLAFLGRWGRFWRMIRRPHKSWLSRGIWGIAMFALGGLGTQIPALRDSAVGRLLLDLSIFGAMVILCYEGFVYAASKGIPFWSTKLLPVLYIAYGLRGGAALLLIAAAFGAGSFDVAALEVIKLWVVVSTAVLILLYLVASSRAGGAARVSVRQLIAGRISPSFYGGTVLAGIVVPLALASLPASLGAPELGVLAAMGVASLVGDFYVKYCIVKAGVYVPTIGPRGVSEQI